MQDIDRAIAVSVDSFVGSQKISCKKALARAFAKYVHTYSVTLSCIQTNTLTYRYTLRRPESATRAGGSGAQRGNRRAAGVVAA